MPALQDNPLLLDPNWPPAFLPDEVVRRLQKATKLVAERPSPLLFFNPEVPWEIGPSPVHQDPGTVYLTSSAPWKPPTFPTGPGVVLFRAFDEARATGVALHLAGYTPIYFPLLRFRYLAPPPHFPETFTHADMLIFTSPRGVEGVFRWLQHFGIPWPDVPVYAIGPSTARALEARVCFGVRIPKTYSAEGLVALLSSESLEGKEVLLLRSGGRPLIPELLRSRNAHVQTLPPYRTEPFPEERLLPFLKEILTAHHWMFTSPSTVQFLKEFLDQQGIAPPATVQIWAIGPATRQTLESLGWPSLESPVHTPEGMVAWMQTHEKEERHVSG